MNRTLVRLLSVSAGMIMLIGASYAAPKAQDAPGGDATTTMHEAAKAHLERGELTEAAQAYEHYAKAFSKHDDAPKAMFEAGRLYEKLGDIKQQRRIYKKFIATFKSRDGEDVRVLDATLRLAKIAKSAKRRGTSKKLLKKVVSEFKSRQLQPATPAADIAAEASFLLLEPKVKTYMKLRSKKNKSMEKNIRVIQKKTQLLDALRNELRAIMKEYRSKDWSTCSALQQGKLFEELGEALRAHPQPEGLDEEDLDRYHDIFEEQFTRVIDEARKIYARALGRAREFKVDHACLTDFVNNHVWVICGSLPDPRSFELKACPQDLHKLASHTRLVSLGLKGGEINDKSLTYVARLKELSDLDLSNTAITDKGLKELRGLTALTKLDLSHTAVTDKGLEELKGLTALESLAVEGSTISPEGYKHFVDGHKKLRALRDDKQGKPAEAQPKPSKATQKKSGTPPSAK